MVFSSSVFLLMFLPLFLASYYLTPMRWRSLTILIGSYLFYAWWRVDFVFLFIFVTVYNYATSRYMVEAEGAARRRWLALGVGGNLAVLGYFKYFNFGIDAFNQLLTSLGAGSLEAWSVILPIGISFYIFQAISYQVDVFRGDAHVARRFLDFAAFIALFPQLIAGPVLRYKDLEYQFISREHSLDRFNEGCVRFAMGFAKKVLIADSLASVADMMFALPDPTMAEAWLGALAYTAQLYFDFSGYSDMAIGLGLMMGFRFSENFNHPYISRSITEFWRRWHMSLSIWLRDYLYIPLGGNRKGAVRTYVNLLLTMVLGGLWHGANWTFVLWGAWHGLVLAIERLLGGKRGTPYPQLLALPATFLIVILGWVMFRAENVQVAMGMYAAMFGLSEAGLGLSGRTAWDITRFDVFMLLVAYGLIFLMPTLMRRWHGNGETLAPDWAARLPVFRQLLVIALFVLAVIKMIAQSFSPFLYFQF